MSERALELGQSYPAGTPLEVPEIRQASEIWIEMIDRAAQRIDIEQFYMTSGDDGPMERVLDALARASARGVIIRLIVDRHFYEREYATVPDRLGALPGASLRTISFRELAGGVQHAKFFVVDGTDAWIGSQNFDWRSLEHITELGVRARDAALVDPLCAIFETDWCVAGEEPLPASAAAEEPAPIDYAGSPHRAWTVASPRGHLPDPSRFDLPRLIEWIDGASERISIQLLTYALVGHDGEYWDELDRALRRAAHRRVRVRLMVADWARRRPEQLAALASLSAVPWIEVRMVGVPDAPSGPIPFARVIHTKAMVVDGQRAWLGTNNWTKDYFESSRNVGLMVEGRAFARDVERAFQHVWASNFAYCVGASDLADVMSRIATLRHQGRVPIVVFDLDSTLLDPGPRNLRILQEFARDDGEARASYGALLASVVADDIGWNLRETLRERGLTDDAVLTRLNAYWFPRFFTNDYVACDLPNPGAVEFTRACHEAGAVVYYMTGRHHRYVPDGSGASAPPFPDGMEIGTLEVLARHGFPITGGRALLHLKPRFDQHDAEFKKGAFRVLDSLGGTVVATFENEPGNANQFLDAYPDATHFWLLTEHSPEAPQPDPRLVAIEDFHVRRFPADPVPDPASAQSSE